MTLKQKSDGGSSVVVVTRVAVVVVETLDTLVLVWVECVDVVTVVMWHGSCEEHRVSRIAGAGPHLLSVCSEGTSHSSAPEDT
jgi:hypothetical protein